MATLASNQRQVWRGCFARGHAHEFVNAARASGATHMLCVRNAETVAPAEGRMIIPEEEPADVSEGGAPAAAAKARPASGGGVLRRVSGNGAATQMPSKLGRTGSSPALMTGAEAPSSDDLTPLAEAQLTDRGTAQCMISRDVWYRRMPMRRVLFSSPALCARQTALHIMGRALDADRLLSDHAATTNATNAAAGTATAATADAGATTTKSRCAGTPPAALLVSDGKGRSHELTPCETLLPREPGSACGELFAQKGLAPLRAYLDTEGGERAFGTYAESVCEELAERMRGLADAAESTGSRRERDTYVGCFGQPVYLHSLAYAVAAAAGMRPAELDAMMDVELGEAEALLVPLYGLGKPVVHLKRPN